MKLHSYITLFTKINSKLIKDLNRRPETVKLLEKEIGKNLHVDLGTDFFGYDITSTSNKIKNKQMGLHQTVNLLHSKRNNQQHEKVTFGWMKISANHTLDRGLISKIYKELIQLNNKTINNGQRNE